MTTVLSLIATPADLLLQIIEKQLYQRAQEPRLPIIFVTGAPRTGTSVVAQVLIKHLPVSYLNNLTAVFRRSPIVSNILFKNLLKKEINYRSYYGKTYGFSGHNDALYIWDHWIGKDRTKIPEFLPEKSKNEMIRFFGGYEAAFGRPMVNKHNNMNLYASLIADTLKTSFFICITRDPIYLAQSLLKARIDIHNDLFTPYGIHRQNPKEREIGDYVADICEQVLYHEKGARKQQRIIGKERFWIVSYEDFCRKPEDLVKRVSEQILDQSVDMDKLRETLKPFITANEVKIEFDLFERIQETFRRLNRVARA
jgi:hypothetical protein